MLGHVRLVMSAVVMVGVGSASLVDVGHVMLGDDRLGHVLLC